MAKLTAQDIVERLLSPLAISKEHRDQAAATISRLTADNEAERAAMDVTQRRAIAAEARADALAQEVERLRLPEGTLAKHGSTITIEFDNAEYALRAFDAIEYAMSREASALANEEAGR